MKKEPSADIRQVADVVRQFYVSLVDEQFTPAEAMQLTAAFVTAQMRAGGGQ
jgi:hypothetical protein